MGGGGGSYVPPQPKPRWLQDTSNEIIKSKYELSDENKRRNALRTKARLLARRQIMVDNDGGDGPDDSSPTGGPIGSMSVGVSAESLDAYNDDPDNEANGFGQA